MDEYPSAWSAWDIIGRNLVATPSWTGTSNRGEWTAGGLTAADTVSGYRLGGINADIKQCPLDGLSITADAGRQVTIWLNHFNGAGEGRVGVTALGHHVPHTAPLQDGMAPVPAHTTTVPYGWHKVTVTLPAGPFTSKHGDPVTTNTYAVTVSGPSAGFTIGGVRVDLASTPLDGYFDLHYEHPEGFTDDLVIEATDEYSGAGPFLAYATTSGGEPEPEPTVVTVDPLEPAELNKGESVTVPLSGSTTHTDPYLHWTVTGLPAGLSGPSEYGTPEIYGTPSSVGSGEATVTATDLTGSSGSTTWAWGVTDPEEPDPEEPDPEEPDPEEPDPEPGELARELAPLVLAYTGRPPSDSAALAMAEAQVPIVADFVHGYTRGRGFEGGQPERPLRSVIVSAASRLLSNPTQARQYAVADFSTSPAVLNGYTLAELGVLHRYRRRQA